MEQYEKFSPSKEFSSKAAVPSMAEYEKLRALADKDAEKFWTERAADIHWFKKWDKVLDWSNPPFAKWFIGAKTNVAYNCLDRHLGTRQPKERQVDLITGSSQRMDAR